MDARPTGHKHASVTTIHTQGQVPFRETPHLQRVTDPVSNLECQKDPVPQLHQMQPRSHIRSNVKQHGKPYPSRNLTHLPLPDKMGQDWPVRPRGKVYRPLTVRHLRTPGIFRKIWGQDRLCDLSPGRARRSSCQQKYIWWNINDGSPSRIITNKSSLS